MPGFRRPRRSTSGRPRDGSARSSARSRSPRPPIRPRADELARAAARTARRADPRAARARGALEATAACPACGEQAEFAVDAAALLATQDAVPPAPVEVDGLVVHWRPPDSRDVAAAALAGDAAGRRARAARRAASTHRRRRAAGRTCAPSVARAMAEADPLAEVLVDVVCPACETQFVADLDVGVVRLGRGQRARAAAAARRGRARARVRLDRAGGARARRPAA